MDLEHSFTVPVGVDDAWAHFQDIASVAECFPGAQVTDTEGATFHGSVKVKLGPIALVYNGSGTFTEKDETAHRFVVDAKGKDKRGNGTAGATVTLSMHGTADSTDVKVHTDLAITGKPAQFGRGVMQDVSDKLLGQFVACLEQRMGEDGSPAAPAAPTEAAPAAPAAVAEPAAPAVAAEAEAPLQAAVPAEAAAPPEAAASAEAVAPPEAAAPPEVASGAEAAEAPVTPVAGATPPPAATSRAAAPTRARGSDDALDLGRTVLPVIFKAYWKPVLLALVVLAVIIWLIVR
jgi:carbon monoxide dehydrogenase subunit G